jgi:hypothetical protein
MVYGQSKWIMFLWYFALLKYAVYVYIYQMIASNDSISDYIWMVKSLNWLVLISI